MKSDFNKQSHFNKTKLYERLLYIILFLLDALLKTILYAILYLSKHCRNIHGIPDNIIPGLSIILGEWSICCTPVGLARLVHVFAADAATPGLRSGIAAHVAAPPPPRNTRDKKHFSSGISHYIEV
jgi:hypothetical protein